MNRIKKLAKEYCGCNRHELRDFEHVCKDWIEGFKKARELSAFLCSEWGEEYIARKIHEIGEK